MIIAIVIFYDRCSSIQCYKSVRHTAKNEKRTLTNWSKRAWRRLSRPWPFDRLFVPGIFPCPVRCVARPGWDRRRPEIPDGVCWSCTRQVWWPTKQVTRRSGCSTDPGRRRRRPRYKRWPALGWALWERITIGTAVVWWSRAPWARGGIRTVASGPSAARGVWRTSSASTATGTWRTPRSGTASTWTPTGTEFWGNRTLWAWPGRPWTELVCRSSASRCFCLGTFGAGGRTPAPPAAASCPRPCSCSWTRRRAPWGPAAGLSPCTAVAGRPAADPCSSSNRERRRPRWPPSHPAVPPAPRALPSAGNRPPNRPRTSCDNRSSRLPRPPKCPSRASSSRSGSIACDWACQQILNGYDTRSRGVFLQDYSKEIFFQVCFEKILSFFKFSVIHVRFAKSLNHVSVLQKFGLLFRKSCFARPRTLKATILVNKTHSFTREKWELLLCCSDFVFVLFFFFIKLRFEKHKYNSF